MKWLLAFSVLLLLLIVWRWEIIDSPPYWDAAMGLFVEANYLADTHFDYRRLWTEEKRFTEGGPAVYLISILPTVIAVGMSVERSTRALLVEAHVFTLACVSASLLAVFAMLHRRTGALGAALVCLAIATTPLFAAQTDFLGMDIPSTAAALAAILLLTTGRFQASAGMSFLAFLCKPSGGIATAAAVFYLLLLFALEFGRVPSRVERSYWLGLGSNLLVLGCEMALFRSVQEHPSSTVEESRVDPWAGLRVFGSLWDWCPDLVILLGVAFILWTSGAVGRLVAAALRARSKGLQRRAAAARSFRSFIQASPIEIIGWMIIFATLLAIAMIYPIPRYLTLLVPFLWMVLALSLFSDPRIQKPAAVAACALVVFNLINIDGRFLTKFGPDKMSELRTGGILERSREYLADHRDNLAAVRAIVEKSGKAPIVAGAPFVHFLSLPRLGYVDAPLHGYSVNTYQSKTFRNLNEILVDKPPSTILVFLRNRFSDIASPAVPPPEPAVRDFLYRKDEPSPLIVYRKDWIQSKDGPTIDITRYFWPEKGKAKWAIELARMGRLEEAKGKLVEVLGEKHLDAEARFSLASVLSAQGDKEGAVEQFRWLVKFYPQTPAAHNGLAMALAEINDLPGASRHLEEAIKLEPNYGEAHRNTGLLLLKEGKKEEAIAQFRKALACESNDLSARFLLAETLLQTGKMDEATPLLESILVQNPKAPKVHYDLGGVAMQKGDQAKAIHHFREALLLDPQWLDAANNLAWLLATAKEPRLRDGAEAVRIAKAICERQPSGNPDFWDTLAAAYAETGEWDQATAAIAKALEQSTSDPERKAKFEKRASLYRSKRRAYE